MSLNSDPRPTDDPAMARTFTLVVLLSALVAGWWLLSTTYRQIGPQADREPVTGPLALEKAADALEGWRAESGTYEGVNLGDFAGVSVIRADASAYCIQVTYQG